MLSFDYHKQFISITETEDRDIHLNMERRETAHVMETDSKILNQEKYPTLIIQFLNILYS